MRFISFGSGSSGNCYYLSSGDDAILIDAGVGIRMLKRYFTNYGLKMSSVHNIIITHDHADHIKSVGSLSQLYHLPVYATELVHKGIDRNWCVKKKIDAASRHFITKNESFTLDGFTITPFNVPHDSSDNVGYTIEAEGKVFTIITDCGHITDEMGPIINRTDYLVIEANHDLDMLANGPYPVYLQNRITSPTGHLSNDTCGKAVAEFASPSLKHIWLCHLSEKNNNPSTAFDTVDGILREHGLIPGENIQLDVLKRTSPTGIFDL